METRSNAQIPKRDDATNTGIIGFREEDQNRSTGSRTENQVTQAKNQFGAGRAR
jgi:hypothetical protein